VDIINAHTGIPHNFANVPTDLPKLGSRWVNVSTYGETGTIGHDDHNAPMCDEEWTIPPGHGWRVFGVRFLNGEWCVDIASDEFEIAGVPGYSMATTPAVAVLRSDFLPEEMVVRS
jgi:hypothetical protein